ncbi:MAG: sulfite exporter TauE/SafE family protein [Gemmatimonadaceae bacterium]|nr:sulfite exporter TauE/SafE family protein [Gemmatimonadaceae bacterium]
MLGYFFAALIGLALGTLGGGGSILTVPVFVYVLGFDPKLSIALRLTVFGLAAIFGVFTYGRAANVRLQTASMFGTIGLVGSYAGARASVWFSGRAQLLILGAVMVIAAASMWRNASRTGDSVEHDHTPHPALLLAVGLGVGLLTGLVGIGGGFLIVPALVVLGRVPMKAAVGTSLLVIAMNSASGYLGHRGYETVPWPFVVKFASVAVLGILAGTALVHHIPTRLLKRAFSALLVLIGVLILWQNRTQF